jgi:hypothetical protein
VLAQEPGQRLGGLPADIEYSGVGDTGRHVEPLVVRNLILADLFLPEASRLSDARSPRGTPAPRTVTFRNRHVAEKTSLRPVSMFDRGC